MQGARLNSGTPLRDRRQRQFRAILLGRDGRTGFAPQAVWQDHRHRDHPARSRSCQRTAGSERSVFAGAGLDFGGAGLLALS